MHYAAALALALLLAAPAAAATITLDFEEEAGFHTEGFVSSECACVHLYGITTSGVSLDPPDEPLADLGLWVADFDELNGSDGRTDGLAVLVGHEGARLVMKFLVPVVALSLDFGNDSPESAEFLPFASLTGFDADEEVLAQSVVTPNHDWIVNQTISISSGNAIALAVFDFRQLGESEPLDFIVDNLVLTTVPEPGTLGLAALACSGLLGRVRRKT